MIKLIQTHMKKKRVLARAAQPKETVNVCKDDIRRKLQDYQPSDSEQRANFLGPKIDKKEFESA